MRLTPRLEMVHELVCGNSAADIGCDHGKLATRLLQSGKVSRVIACDVSAPSLQKARDLGCEARLGDGLAPLEAGEVECVIIAGMGGELTARILERGREKLCGAALVLQPMQQLEYLHRWLREHGFVIETESLIREGRRFYVALRAREGISAVGDEWLFDNFGLLMEQNPPLLKEYVESKLASARHSLQSIQADTCAAVSARQAINEHIVRLERCKAALSAK